MTEKQRLDHLYEVMDDLLHELNLERGGLAKVTFDMLRQKLKDGMSADAESE